MENNNNLSQIKLSGAAEGCDTVRTRSGRKHSHGSGRNLQVNSTPHVDSGDTSRYSNDIVVSNIYEGSDQEHQSVAFAVLAMVLPEIKKEDIVVVRRLRSERQGGSITTHGRTANKTSPWVVTLSCKDLGM